MLLRADSADMRTASSAVLVLANPDGRRDAVLDGTISPLPAQAGAALMLVQPLDGGDTPGALLHPGEVRVLAYEPTDLIVHPLVRDGDLDPVRLSANRIAIENVQPCVPDGPFAVSRLVGERVVVNADIFADGHEVLAAELLWHTADEAGWHRVPMQLVTNDRWEASFSPQRVGRHRFTIEAWWDVWATFRHDLSAKHAAGQDVTLEIEEGRRMLEAAAKRAPQATQIALSNAVMRLPSLDAVAQVALLLNDTTADLMHIADDRAFGTQHEPAIALDIERPQA